MRLTTRGRYAVTAAVALAMQPDPRRAVPVADIVEGSGLSRSYLEQLLARLRRAGLLEGRRGAAGGYRLAAPAEEISIAQIVQAVDHMDATACGGTSDCHAGAQCLTHNLWTGLNHCVAEFLSGITLAQVARDVPKCPSSADPWARVPLRLLDGQGGRLERES